LPYNTYCGLPGFFFIIMGVSLFTGGGGALTFWSWFIWRRSVAGSGMPGVGVTPGFKPFFSSTGLGIPGVGVAPFGRAVTFAGMPGVLFPDGWTGLVEIPGGILFGSTLTFVFVFAVFAFAARLDPAGAPEPQPKLKTNIRKHTEISRTFDIYYCIPRDLK